MAVEFITRKEFNNLAKKVDLINQRLIRVEEKIDTMEERLLSAFERHTKALLEEFIHRLGVVGEGFGIHEQRINVLEIKTGLKSA